MAISLEITVVKLWGLDTSVSRESETVKVSFIPCSQSYTPV